jgi:hypothetical protein
MNARSVWFSLVWVVLASACGPIEFATKKVVQVRNEAGAPLCQLQHLVYDLGAEPSFNDLKANVGALSVVNIAATVTDVLEGNSATRAHGALSLQADTGETLSLASYEGIAVTPAATARLALDQPTAQTLGQVLLTAPHRVTIDAMGCSDHVPAQFDLQLEFTLGADVKLF